MPFHGTAIFMPRQSESRQALARRLSKIKCRPVRPAPAKFYCSGGLPTELGFTERMKVMIFHS